MKFTFALSAILILGAQRSLAQNPGQLKWTAPINTAGVGIEGSAAVWSGAAGPPILYITANDGFLYAIDTTTHQLPSTWSQPVYLANTWGIAVGSGELIGSPTITSDGTIYVASSDHNLYSINPNNGAINWPLPIPDNAFTRPGAVAVGPNGILYVTFDDETILYAIKPFPDHGEIQWSLDMQAARGTEVRIDSPPTVGADGTIFFYESEEVGVTKLIAVTDEGCNGAVKWAADLGFGEDVDDFRSTLVLDNAGRIYAPFNTGSIGLMAFNITNGQPVVAGTAWPFSTPSGANIRSSPAIGANGTLYFGADDGVFYAVNPDGTLKWTFAAPSGYPTASPIGAPIVSSAVLAADGSIYFGTEEGRMWGIQEEDNGPRLLWSYPSIFSQSAFGGAIRSSPILVGQDNAMYFGCDDGNVYSIIASANLPAAPWPMFRKDLGRTASSAPPTLAQPTWWVGAQLEGPADIYKGLNGIVPPGGETWFTISRSSCTASLNTSLQVTFLLGGDGTALSTPHYNYNPAFAYSGLDFTVSGCTQAPFPNGFYVIFAPGQAQATVYVNTLNSSEPDSPDPQTLWLTIPPNQSGYSPGTTPATASIHPNPND